MKIIESCKKEKRTTVADTKPGDVFTFDSDRCFIRVAMNNYLVVVSRRDYILALTEDGRLTFFFGGDESCTIHKDAVLVLEPEED